VGREVIERSLNRPYVIGALTNVETIAIMEEDLESIEAEAELLLCRPPHLKTIRALAEICYYPCTHDNAEYHWSILPIIPDFGEHLNRLCKLGSRFQCRPMELLAASCTSAQQVRKVDYIPFSPKGCYGLKGELAKQYHLDPDRVVLKTNDIKVDLAFLTDTSNPDGLVLDGECLLSCVWRAVMGLSGSHGG